MNSKHGAGSRRRFDPVLDRLAGSSVAPGNLVAVQRLDILDQLFRKAGVGLDRDRFAGRDFAFALVEEGGALEALLQGQRGVVGGRTEHRLVDMALALGRAFRCILGGVSHGEGTTLGEALRPMFYCRGE